MSDTNQSQKRPTFQEDLECVGFQWINQVKDEKGDVKLTESGHAVNLTGAIHKGGYAIANDLDANGINKMLADGEAVGFVNGKFIVYRISNRSKKREDIA